MVFNHMMFDPRILNFLHNDTFKFTTIREPLQHFISTFQFFSQSPKQTYLHDIPGPSPIHTFLADTARYEAPGYTSLTNNRQSLDLGFDLDNYSLNDTRYIDHFVDVVDQQFDLVLISDYFDESLILLKRLLRWSTQDVIYFKKLSSGKSKKPDVDEELRELHRKHSMADRALYDHFIDIFQHRLSQQRGLAEEVSEFRDVLKRVWQFCDSKDKHVKQLIIPRGAWTDQVSILRPKCRWLRMPAPSFTEELKKLQTSRLEGNSTKLVSRGRHSIGERKNNTRLIKGDKQRKHMKVKTKSN